jgi:hypothetical protein
MPLELGDPRDAVRPRRQDVPRASQPVQHARREAAWINASLGQDLIEVLPVQHVQGDEGPLSRANQRHRGRVTPSPGVSEGLGLKGQPMLGRELAHGIRDPGSPVHDGAEGVEQHRLHDRARRGRPEPASHSGSLYGSLPHWAHD